MTKSQIRVVIAVACCAAPVIAFAQSGGALTREQVRAEIIDLQTVGYSPGTASDNDFPGNIQAAEARLAAQRAGAQSASGGYGPAAGGSSEAGGPNSRLAP
jgi:hypothetical protein